MDYSCILLPCLVIILSFNFCGCDPVPTHFIIDDYYDEITDKQSKGKKILMFFINNNDIFFTHLKIISIYCLIMLIFFIIVCKIKIH